MSIHFSKILAFIGNILSFFQICLFSFFLNQLYNPSTLKISVIKLCLKYKTGEIIAVLKIGIMPREKFQQRILDITSGKYKPKRNEPKIWFHSMKSVGEPAQNIISL